MARKDPYKIVKVNNRIYAELDKCREKDSRDEFKLPTMNGYIERILWDYATGKITREGGKLPRSIDLRGATFGTPVIEEEETPGHSQTHTGKKRFRRSA